MSEDGTGNELMLVAFSELLHCVEVVLLKFTQLDDCGEPQIVLFRCANARNQPRTHVLIIGEHKDHYAPYGSFHRMNAPIMISHVITFRIG